MRCNICKKNNHETFDCFFRFKTGIRTKRKQGGQIQKPISKQIKIDERNPSKLPTSLAHQTTDKKEIKTEAHECMFAPMKRPKKATTPTLPHLPTSTSSEPYKTSFSTGSVSTQCVGTCNITDHFNLKTEMREMNCTINSMNNKIAELRSLTEHLKGENKDIAFDNELLRKENAKLHRENIFSPYDCVPDYLTVFIKRA